MSPQVLKLFAGSVSLSFCRSLTMCFALPNRSQPDRLEPITLGAIFLGGAVF
jgi:hypothetical protein